MVESNLPSLISVALTLLTVLIPALAAIAVELLRRKVGVEKMIAIQEELNAKQEMGLMAVRFAQQAYKDYDGAKRYGIAAKFLSSQARARGLKLSEQEIRFIIESSLRMLKDNFVEAWTQATAEEENTGE